jgi:hypothetical protein
MLDDFVNFASQLAGVEVKIILHLTLYGTLDDE